MDTEEVTSVEMRELTLADVQEDKAAEKGQIKGTKDVYKKLYLFKWISAVFIVLTLVLLAVVLALVVKLYEPQSCQNCDALSLKTERIPYTSNQEYQCSECPKDWVRVNNSCYFLAKERLSWQESRKSCQKQGGDLAVIDNESEQRLLSRIRGLLYWIGLQYSENKQWMWVNNNALTKNYWAQDQPVLDPQGTCTMLKGQMPYTNNWHSNPCTATAHYICQISLLKKK
ncbi:natural killer cells antigen CD94-like isoform 2-T4 [Clarias gariepinus]|uniref:CD209 antigen-like protein C isoform X2 n=1 Tax=Clarias gariepinus TaxID=13013 RepID=UPI00234D7CB6|nr:CD209 antigen-like protein C isoform X2 [Clarias gariepinus]